jgi:hypothetical protein
MKKPVRKKHKIFILIGIISFFLVVASLIIIAGFRPIQNQFITSKIISVVKKSGINSCSVDRIILTPWKQIEFYGLHIKKDIDQNHSFDIQLTHCQLQYNLFTLVLHAADLTRTISTIKGDFWNAQLTPVQISSILKRITPINVIRCKGNKIHIVQKGINLVDLKNYSIDISKKNELMPDYEGKIEVESALIDRWPVTKTSADLTFNDRILKIKTSNGQFLSGQFRVFGDINLRSSKILALNCAVTGLSIDKYYSIEKKYPGKIRGRADIKLTIGESFFHRDSLNGKGSIIASGVTVVNLPIQKSLVSLLGFPQMGQVAFDTIRTDFELKSGNKFSNNMNGRGPVIGFSSVGWINGDGNLNQNITGVFTRNFTAILPGIMSESMQETADYGRKFQCRIYGSLDHPKIELSKETLKKAFSGAFDSMKQKIEEMIR